VTGESHHHGVPTRSGFSPFQKGEGRAASEPEEEGARERLSRQRAWCGGQAARYQFWDIKGERVLTGQEILPTNCNQTPSQGRQHRE